MGNQKLFLLGILRPLASLLSHSLNSSTLIYKGKMGLKDSFLLSSHIPSRHSVDLGVTSLLNLLIDTTFPRTALA